MKKLGSSPLVALTCILAPAIWGAACSASGASRSSQFTATSGTTTGPAGVTVGGAGGAGGSATTSNGAGLGGGLVLPDGGGCAVQCSADFHEVIDCNNNVIQTCSGSQACDSTTGTCADACTAATHNKASVGCEFYATDMDQYADGYCFAAFVANTWDTPVHISVDFAGTTLPVSSFAQIPNGAGPSLKYTPYDATAGLAAGEVAILFLAGSAGGMVPCPTAAAMPNSEAQLISQSGMGHSFHITTDVPVVSYEINPYGGGSAAVTGASLLLPTSAWDTNYVVATVSPNDIAAPSMNVIASQDSTTITILPTVAIEGGGGLASGAANTQYKFMLNKGEMAQFTQSADLTGSILQSDKPVGFMAGQPCMRWPVGVAYCDHGEQMVPPVSALGNEYVGVMYRPRVAGDAATWHMIGAVAGTTLTYEPAAPAGAPLTLTAGEVVDFVSAQPFNVKSQDTMHPFLMFAYMSGSQWGMLSDQSGYGDPDFVLSVPPQQYLDNYVFFADPTYPETNLVVVREQNAQKGFDDVTLDCLTGSTLTGWQPVGDYEWTRVDLITGNFQGVNGCTTGRHQMQSKTPFGLWVWGWGTPNTSSFTANVSYGYPGGMNVRPINTVVIPPTPQ